MYDCPRCHYHTTKKGAFIEHLTRKSMCTGTFSDEDLTPIYNKLREQMKITKTHICSQCNKGFSYASGLSRHKKEHLSLTINDNTASSSTTTNVTNTNSNNTTNNQNSNNTTSNQNSHNNTTITNSQNTFNIQTLNMNVQLLPFGEEDIRHVEDDKTMLLECLKKILTDGIPNIIEKIHFNSAVPQNHNVKLKRIKHPATMLVYTKNSDGQTGWEEKSMDTTLDALIDNGCDILIKFKTNDLPIDFNDRDQVEINDMRNEKISNIKSKKRGVYGQIKTGVICKAKESR